MSASEAAELGSHGGCEQLPDATHKAALAKADMILPVEASAMTSIMKTALRPICCATLVCSAVFTSLGTLMQATAQSHNLLRFRMTETFPGRKPDWAILIRVYLTAALALPVFGASAGVVLTSRHSFQVFTNGANPSGRLVQGSDGNLYGTTSGGGTNGGNGTVFRISATGALTTLHSFTGGKEGADPQAGLVQGSDGNFYGTTAHGGTNGDFGTVFRISATGELTTLYSFTGARAVGSPYAGLVQGSDGNFYGTTDGDGQDGDPGAGTIFRLSEVAPATPAFQAVTLAHGTLSLTWTTEAGNGYQLQSTSDLDSTNWINLGSAQTATGTALTFADSISNGPQRFYRLALLP